MHLFSFSNDFMICDFNDTAHSTRDISVQYEGCLGGGGKEGGRGGGGVEGGALLILLTQEYELLLGWLPLVRLLLIAILAADCVDDLNLGVIVQGDLLNMLLLALCSPRHR